jgi:glycosyltransferase involved in cell wall biosynthesis
MLQVGLVWLGYSPAEISWTVGPVLSIPPLPEDVARRSSQALAQSQADAWLFWDASLGAPDPAAIVDALSRPGDVWHAGLRLGMGGLPGVIDFIAPTWMLNRDPDPAIEATSWRVSLRACLARRQVLEQMGFIRPEFHTLEAAALEWGHRCIRHGVVARHLAGLLTAPPDRMPVTMPLEDELRFALYAYGRKWALWALLRAALSGYAAPGAALKAWQRLRRVPAPPPPRPYRRDTAAPDVAGAAAQAPGRISVLIPTLERYPYLRTLLAQLRRQTVRPAEIIVVDQTDPLRRQPGLAEEFGDLPLRWIYRDQPGQCSSRNAGLRSAKGEFILLLDDDVEIGEMLVENFLAAIARHGAQVVSGMAYETYIKPLVDTSSIRVSDVFPAGITIIQKQILLKTGLFDLAFEHGARADGDLGMRVYLSGALMLLDPAAAVIHHHAPSGGLRTHKARVVTYASSRERLTQRHLSSVTELYLARRYFSPRQLREMLWLNVLGTFSLHGGWGRRLVKIAVSLLLLPDTLFTLWRRDRQARRMLGRYPQIPQLENTEER